MSMDILIIVAAMAVAGPAGAKAAKPVKERLECRTEISSNTRLGRKRICTTRKIWDQVRDENLESTAFRKDAAERSMPCTSLPCR